MSDIDLKQIVLEELDYTEASGLKSSNLWPNGRPILYVEDAYFIQDVPVVYFSRFDDPNPDPDDIWRLYRSVWSQSKVPLLYVILPTEIRIYNSYAGPPKKTEELLNKGSRMLRILKQLTKVEAARQEIRNQLSDYKRIHLDTGAFWSTDDGQHIKREKRADQRLLQAMDQVRRRLTNPDSGQGLSNDLAYALLGRSIFIRYLEARGVLDVSELTEGQAKDYLSVLALEDPNITNLLFERLSERFNGDLFPVDKEGRERKEIQPSHLKLLRSFLMADRFEKGRLSQLSLWPYDFEHIPIELISGIYDTFLYNDSDTDANENEKKRRRLGAYYTPLPLVELVVDETLPLDKTRSNMTILDPACGSGVFLVRAYQRLVAAWKRDYINEQPAAQDLSTILTSSIFGIDKELNAIQIAAFSLYLTMLDYLGNKEIEEKSFHFPNLKKTNLIAADFFSKEVDNIFSDKKFDRIIGNPPWGRGTLTEDASEWLRKQKYKVAGKQIVQAFLLRAPDFCTDDGEVALLAPVKSTILVSGSTYIAFRQRFFKRYHVRAVVNLSVLRHELFVSSVSPSAALFYQRKQPSVHNNLIYGVPKPSSLSQRLGTIVLDATEVKFLDREELLAHPVLWKVASWGSPRDAALIERLQSFPTLKQQSDKDKLDWKIDEGFMSEYPGSDKIPAPYLQGMPFLPTEHFQPYIVEPTKTVEASIFHRPRPPETYQGPMVLIHKSECQAAFSSNNVAYASSITGVRGSRENEDYLKWLAAYINSPLVKYYQFLTSSRWAVERDNPVQGEYENMPFLLPKGNDPRLVKILEHFDQIADLYRQRNRPLSSLYEADIQEHKTDIDNLVFDIYKISTVERRLIRDMVEYEIEFFYWAERKQRAAYDSRVSAIQRPNNMMLGEYAETFVKTVTTFLRYEEQTLNATVYYDGAPLSVIEFELVSLNQTRAVEFVKVSQELESILRRLDRLLLEQQASTLYTRRHVRIFTGTQFYLVRPSERRFWTGSQAYTDADGFIAEMLTRSRTEIGVSH